MRHGLADKMGWQEFGGCDDDHPLLVFGGAAGVSALIRDGSLAAFS